MISRNDPDFEFSIHKGPSYVPCDIAVIYGEPANGNSPKKAFRQDIIDRHRGPILYVEAGLLGRRYVFSFRQALRRLFKPTPSLHLPVETYYRAGLDSALPGRADYLNDGSPPDRWEAMAERLSLKIEPYRQSGRHILLIGQVPGDAALDGLDMGDWIVETISGIRQRTDMPIIFRAHPGMKPAGFSDINARIAHIRDVETSFNIDDESKQRQLRDAHCCVCYSSSFSLESLLAGVPVIALSPLNVAYALCSHSLDDIQDPPLPDREQYFHNLAYAQWTQAEFASGAVIDHFRERLKQLAGIES